MVLKPLWGCCKASRGQHLALGSLAIPGQVQEGGSGCVWVVGSALFVSPHAGKNQSYICVAGHGYLEMFYHHCGGWESMILFPLGAACLCLCKEWFCGPCLPGPVLVNTKHMPLISPLTSALDVFILTLRMAFAACFCLLLDFGVKYERISFPLCHACVCLICSWVFVCTYQSYPIPQHHQTP